MKQLMNGFQELYRNKIMHRDFKPANVFIHKDSPNSKETLVIGDFGFARQGADITKS
jgi:serine/threonine protein kinase